MSLGNYIRKRDFARTAEPPGTGPAKGGIQKRFVIQKHDARRLHYDLRLEMGGTLKSWAVPRGIPFRKGEKRLAVQVEDHPIEYANFEGVIPKGEYGGGTVMVWDSGTYDLLDPNSQDDLAAGKLHFALHGKKLEGEWTLVRINRTEKNEWLLIKTGNDLRPVSKKMENESSLSGRTMQQIGPASGAGSRSDHAESKAKLHFIPPMKATPVNRLPEGGDWSYELKFDGYRAQAIKEGGEVKLFSSTGKALHFSKITEAIRALPAESVILDGEIVALDEEGRSSFQLLQALETTGAAPALAFYAFDLLYENGANLLDRSLRERREALSKLFRHACEPLRYSADIRGDPEEIVKEVRKRGLEGIIAKKRGSRYESGRRSRSWIKLKCVNEQEFVIGGYTLPEGTRTHFGALLVGYRSGEQLRFAGKVGTGFTMALLSSLHQKMRESNRCPFADLPEKQEGRWSQNITPGEMKRCRWVEPVLVCQVRFTEWTRDGKLRHPVFLGLRDDKDPREVVRERCEVKL